MFTSSIDHSITEPETSLSPKKGSAEFDALVELLATDADDAIDFSTKSTRRDNVPVNLRDEDGVYDFAKIRDFFSSAAHPYSAEQTPTTKGKDGEADLANLRQLRAALAPAVVEPTIPRAPALLQHDPASAAISPLFLSPTPSTLSLAQQGQIFLKVKNPKLATPRKIQVVYPDDTLDSSPDLDFAELTRALESANEQIGTLKKNYQVLREEAEQQGLYLEEPGEQPTQPYRLIQCSLGLPSLTQITSPESKFAGREPQTISDIQRAVEFLKDCDELVWRRKTNELADSKAPLDVFSVQNIKAVMDRVELWERIVRKPAV